MILTDLIVNPNFRLLDIFRNSDSTKDDTLKDKRDLQKLSDVSPVYTHCGHFCAAVLMELVATRLAPETI